MSVMTLDPFDREQGRETALWTVAAVIVAALHVGLAAAYLVLRPVPEGHAEAPAVDVAFVPAAVPPAPEALPASPTPPEDQSMLAPPQSEPVPADAAAPPTPAQPEPQDRVVQPEPQPMPQPEPPVALTAPEPPRAEDAIVAAHAPPPKVTEATPDSHKPVATPEHIERKPVEKPEHKLAPAKPAAQPVAKPAAEASKPTRMAAAPNPGAESEGARTGMASWNSEVAAQIRRAAAYPSDGNGASGTVMVSIVVDRNGRLLSHRLAGSSGSAALDRAAISIIARAQPFPHFPAGMTQAQVARTVPLHLRPR